MSLQHNRAARRQGRGGIAPRHREGERKVAGGKNDDRAHRGSSSDAGQGEARESTRGRGGRWTPPSTPLLRPGPQTAEAGRWCDPIPRPAERHPGGFRRQREAPVRRRQRRGHRPPHAGRRLERGGSSRPTVGWRPRPRPVDPPAHRGRSRSEFRRPSAAPSAAGTATAASGRRHYNVSGGCPDPRRTGVSSPRLASTGKPSGTGTASNARSA